MMRSPSRAWTAIPVLIRAGVLACAIMAPASAAATTHHFFLSRVDFARKRAEVWKLPHRLREISGLAVSDDGRVLTHEDNKGIVYQIDPADGDIVKSFALGNPATKGDFEGIAVAGGKVYLVTSDGVIYEAPEGKDGTHVRYNRYETGIGRHCEVEGLAFDAAAGALLIPCKTIRDTRFENDFVLYRWSLTTRAVPSGPSLVVPLGTLFAAEGGRKSFRPSGIEIVPKSGNYLIVASLNHLIVEMTPAGVLEAAVKLDHHDHPQAEGVTIGPGPVLLISDEGGKHRGRLSVYHLRESAASRAGH